MGAFPTARREDDAMIGLDRVSFSYEGKEVLRELSYEIPAGARVLLTGPSGCGKTTVLRLLLGLLEPQAGRVIREESCRALFQEDRLLPWRSVLQNLTVCGVPEARARALLEELGLSGLSERRPSELSGGQRRRAALARALGCDCGALLLDEPFTGLDPESADRALAALEKYAAGRTVLLVTHDRSLGERFAGQIWNLGKTTG